jgi:hypothetical protein
MRTISSDQLDNSFENQRIKRSKIIKAPKSSATGLIKQISKQSEHSDPVRSEKTVNSMT